MRPARLSVGCASHPPMVAAHRGPIRAPPAGTRLIELTSLTGKRRFRPGRSCLVYPARRAEAPVPVRQRSGVLTSRTTVGPLAVAPGRADTCLRPRCTAGAAPSTVSSAGVEFLPALTGGRTIKVAESDGYPYRLSHRLLFRYDTPDVGQSVDDLQPPT